MSSDFTSPRPRQVNVAETEHGSVERDSPDPRRARADRSPSITRVSTGSPSSCVYSDVPLVAEAHPKLAEAEDWGATLESKVTNAGVGRHVAAFVGTRTLRIVGTAWQTVTRARVTIAQAATADAVGAAVGRVEAHPGHTELVTSTGSPAVAAIPFVGQGIDAFEVAAVEVRVTDADMGGHVATFIGARALRIVGTAWQTDTCDRVTIGKAATVDALGAAALEARATNAGVGRHVAAFVGTRTLLIVGTAWQTDTRARITIRQTTTADAVGATVGRVEAHPSHAELAGATDCPAVAAISRIGLRVDAEAEDWGATLESRVTNAGVGRHVAVFVGTRALRVADTARQADTRARVTIG